MTMRHSVIGAVALLLGAGGVASSLSGCSISPPSAAAETGEIYVRMYNAVPGSSPMGLLAGDGLQGTRTTLYFGMFSSYSKMASGFYDLGVKPWYSGAADDDLSDNDLLAKTYADLSEPGFFTVMAMGLPNRVDMVVLDDDDQPPLFDKALVRFLHAMPDVDAVQWTGGEEQIYVSVLEYGQASGYIAIEPGYHTLGLREIRFPDVEVPDDPTGLTSEEQLLGRLLEDYDIELLPGRLYTIFSTGLLRGDPQLEVTVAQQGDEDLETVRHQQN